MQEPIAGHRGVPSDDGIDQRLEWMRAILERVRRAESAATRQDELSGRLAYAAQLLETLDAIMPEVQRAEGSRAWNGCDALMARVTFEIYDRAVRELRGVAVEARARIEQAEAVLAEAREFARRRRRRAAKIAARFKSDE